MTYRTYAKCFRRLFRYIGIPFACIIAILGVYSMALSHEILDATLFKVVSVHNRVDDALIRFLSFAMLLVLSYLLGFARKFKLNKKHKLFEGFLYMYPIFSVGFASFITTVIINVSLGNSVNYKIMFRYLLYMAAVGLFEEFLFRGLVQNILLCSFRKDDWILAVFLQALIFGAAHMVNNREGLDKATQCVYSCLAGFLFGLAYYKTKSLISSMLVHSIYDFTLNFSNCFSAWGSGFDVDSGMNWWTVIIAVLICVLFFLVKLLYRMQSRTQVYRNEMILEFSSIKEWKWNMAAQAAFFIDKNVDPL